jgi:hypothetical protein
VGQIALLFGSTWLVNSAVFFTVLILILPTNLYVLKVQRGRLLRHYLGLLTFLTAGVLVPEDVFLSSGIEVDPDFGTRGLVGGLAVPSC